MDVRSWRWVASATVLALLLGPSAAAAGPDQVPAIDPDRSLPTRADAEESATTGVLVRRAPATDEQQLEAAVEDEGLTLGQPLGLDDWWRVETPVDVDPAEVLGDLEAAPAVTEAVEDHVRTATKLPNDDLFAEHQRYLRTIRAPAAWDVTTGSADVIVAVLDTGVQASHPDLTGKVLRGRSFVPGVTSTRDDNGHGTAVAGLIAARTDDGSGGIAGLGWRTRVLPVKVLDGDGAGTDASIAQGIRWAADQGASVINLSLGGDQPSPVLDAAVAYARQQGAVVVAAAGNDSLDEPNYPAASPGALAVGATDTAGQLAFLSNHGDWIDLVAPGFDIVTTSAGPSHYEIVDGTSFAAPLVAGAAALVRARQPSLTPAQVETRLRSSARDAGPRGIDPYYGHGILDVAAAVGRPLAAPFPLGARDGREPDDLAGRAPALPVGTTSATLSPEGDVDWFRVEVGRSTSLTLRVTAPGPDWADARWMDPVVELYDEELRLLDRADDGLVGEPEVISGRVLAGTYLVRVSNWYPSAGRAPYAVRLTTAPAPEPAPFHPYESWTASGPGADADAVGTAIADATGDGHPDLLLTTRGGALELHAGTPAGALGPVVRIAVSDLDPYVTPVAVAQLDEDGPPHVLVGTTTGLRSFRWDGAALVAGTTLDPGHIVDLAVGDVDGDGRDDIIAGMATGGLDVWVHEIDVRESPTKRRLVRYERGGAVPFVAVGDVDGDGRDEVVTARVNGIEVHPRRETGYSQPTRRTIASVAGSRHAIQGLAVGDTDGDGRADVHVTGGGYEDAANVQRFRSPASGELTGLGSAEVTVGVEEFPGIATVGDVTGDGLGDLMVGHASRLTLSVLPGTPGGALGEVTEAELPDSSWYPTGALSVGDIDADGWNDVAIAGRVPMAVLRNLAGQPPAADDAPADHWVRDAAPVPLASDVGHHSPLRVETAREVTAASAAAPGVVRLVDARTGTVVPAAVSVTGARTLVVTPSKPLIAATPYALRVDGLRSPDGDEQDEPLHVPFVAARDTTAPPAVTGVSAASTAPGRVRVGWTSPSVGDLDLIEVRATDTTTWPTTRTGALVYRGRGSSFTLDGLDASRVRSYGIWAIDRSGNRSSRATVRLDGTLLTGSRSATKVVHGQSVHLTGSVTSVASGRAAAGHHVELWERAAPATTWRRAASTTSAKDGSVRFTRTPSATTAYRLRVVGGATSVSAEVGVGTVIAAPRVTATPSRTAVTRGGSLTVSGTVRPTALAGEPVQLQRLRDGAWVRVQAGTIRSDGAVRFTSVPTATRGTFTYRVLVPKTPSHAAGAGPRFRVTVQ